MGLVETKANSITEIMNTKYKVDKLMSFDPLLVLAIASIVIQVAQFLYTSCNKTAKDALEIAKSPNIMHRWTLKRIVKKNLDDPELYDRIGQQLVAAVFDVGASSTIEELDGLFKEVQVN